MIDIRLDFLAQSLDTPLDFSSDGCAAAGLQGQAAQAVEFPQTFAADALLVEAGDDFGIGVVAGESGCKKYSGVIPYCVREHPSVGQFGPLGSRLVVHDQGNSGVAQRIDPCADRQLGHAVERGQAVFGETEIAHEVEVPGTGCELDDIIQIVDGFESSFTAFRFDQARDVLLHHGLAQPHGNGLDEHIPAQHALDVGIVEHAVDSRQSQRSAGNAYVHRSLRPLAAGINLESPVEEFGKQPAEFHVPVGCGLNGTRGFSSSFGRIGRHGRRGRGSLRLWRRYRFPDFHCGRFCLLFCENAYAQTRGIQTAKREIEGGRLADPRVVGKQSDHAFAFAQNILNKAVEDSLGTQFDKDAHSGIIQSVEPLHELDRGIHLPSQQAYHLRHDTGAHGVKIPKHVGNDGNFGGTQVHGPEDCGQGIARRRHNPRVEGVADLQRARDIAAVPHGRHRFLDARRRSADYGLFGAVDIGDDDIVVDRGENFFDFVDRPEDGGHHAVVVQGATGHFVTAGADGFQGFLERYGPARHKRAVFAKTVPHDHVRGDAVSVEHAGKGSLGRQDRRLSDRRLLQTIFGSRKRRLIRFVEIDAARQGLAEQRLHDPVRFFIDLGYNRFGRPERLEHVHVLRTLTGEKERHLGDRAFAQENAFGSQRLPPSGLVLLECFQYPSGFVGQFGGVSVIDGQTHIGAQVGLQGRRRLRRFPGRSLLSHGFQPRDQCSFRVRSQHHGAAQRRLEVRGRGIEPGTPGHGDSCLPFARYPSRNIFLQDHVEVRAPEAKSADAGTADAARLYIPWL